MYILDNRRLSQGKEGLNRSESTGFKLSCFGNGNSEHKRILTVSA